MRLPIWHFTVLGMVGFLLIRGGGVHSGQAQVLQPGVRLIEGKSRVQNSLEILSQLSAGKGLIRKAQDLWKETTIEGLSEHFKWGDSSRTDTVLTRHYNPNTDHEERHREVTVFLKEDQSDLELMLDMAHELVHATSRPGFDPYDSSLTPGKYILAALEGEGGEVAALIRECEVGIEFSTLSGERIPRCQSYYRSGVSLHADGADGVDRDKVRRDFYRVGQWHPQLVQKLREERKALPLLSAQSPKLYSSTGHMPYPAALFQEFEEMTSMACENSRKRMLSVASREPVSTSENSRQEIRLFLQNRCR